MAEPRARTEEEKMLAGDLYNSLDPELMAGRTHASAYCEEFNSLGAKVADDVKKGVLKELFGAFGSDTTILAPLRVDYGKYTYIGDRVFMNFGTTILDTCEVRIGNDVLFGPNCSLFTATHPLDPAVRRNWGPELGKPITIGNDVWLGGNVVVLPGVTIGDGVTVGAGSVVTKNVEPYVVVAGNPARIIKRLEKPQDYNSNCKVDK